MESWMGPWSADLPDVSPPEKQLACQRARLYLNTQSNTLRSWMRRLGLWSKNLWLEVMVDKRRWRWREIQRAREREGGGEAFCMWCPKQSCCLGASGLTGCLSAEQAFQHHGQKPERLHEPNISISETCPYSTQNRSAWIIAEEL